MKLQLRYVNLILLVNFTFFSIGCTKKTSSSEAELSEEPLVSTKIAFYSSGSNLIEGVNSSNPKNQVFLKDFVTGEIQLVSANKDGIESDGGGFWVAQSSDASKIAFNGWNSNLVENVLGNHGQTFLKNMKTGEVKLVSSDENGNASNGNSDYELKISGDGNRVAFITDASNLNNNSDGDTVFYVKDVSSGKIIRLDTDNDNKAGNGGSYSVWNAGLSYDGKKIVFESYSSDLIANDTNNDGDVFIKDFDSGELILASTKENGTQIPCRSVEPSISKDGKIIAFTSSYDIQSDSCTKNSIFIKNLVSGSLIQLNTGNGSSSVSEISPDATKIAFYSNSSDLDSNDTFAGADLFVQNISTGETKLITPRLQTSNGREVNSPRFTSDSKKIYFQTGDALVEEDLPRGGGDIFEIDGYLFDLNSSSLISVCKNKYNIISNRLCLFNNAYTN